MKHLSLIILCLLGFLGFLMIETENPFTTIYILGFAAICLSFIIYTVIQHIFQNRISVKDLLTTMLLGLILYISIHYASIFLDLSRSHLKYSVLVLLVAYRKFKSYYSY
jgi:hypothetical protein